MCVTPPRPQGPSFVSSVDIRPEWTVLEQIQLVALTKLSYDVGAPTELCACGSLDFFDKALDRVTPRTELALRRTLKARGPCGPAAEDPVLRALAATPAEAPPPAGAEGGADGAPPAPPSRVFTTDAVLATLMCAPRSVYSWDIVVTHDGDTLWLDSRPGGSIDRLSVNETTQDPNTEGPDSINGMDKLSTEATSVNAAFAAQAVTTGARRVVFAKPDPFLGGAEAPGGCASALAFRYRQWRLDASTLLLARCEVNAALEYKGEELVCTVKALNEADSKASGMDWRQKIETQRGAVLATELKNNANKLAKWTCAALLAGADQMKARGALLREHRLSPPLTAHPSARSATCRAPTPRTRLRT